MRMAIREADVAAGERRNLAVAADHADAIAAGTVGNVDKAVPSNRDTVRIHELRPLTIAVAQPRGTVAGKHVNRRLPGRGDRLYGWIAVPPKCSDHQCRSGGSGHNRGEHGASRETMSPRRAIPHIPW